MKNIVLALVLAVGLVGGGVYANHHLGPVKQHACGHCKTKKMACCPKKAKLTGIKTPVKSVETTKSKD